MSLNHSYVGWATSFQSFFETGWATRPFFDEDNWLFDAPCDSSQIPGGPLEKF